MATSWWIILAIALCRSVYSVPESTLHPAEICWIVSDVEWHNLHLSFISWFSIYLWKFLVGIIWSCIARIKPSVSGNSPPEDNQRKLLCLSIVSSDEALANLPWRALLSHFSVLVLICWSILLMVWELSCKGVYLSYLAIDLWNVELLLLKYFWRFATWLLHKCLMSRTPRPPIFLRGGTFR
jgi:hypothetical protein